MNTPKQIIHKDIQEIGKNLRLSFTAESLVIYEGSNYHVYLTKEDAIEIAKTILLRHNVPFANRVKNAGVAK